MRVATPRARIDRSAAARARTAILDLLFPPRCVVCDRWGDHLCDTCLAGFPRAGRIARCPRCWSPLASGVAPGTTATTPCDDCLLEAPAFRSLRSDFVYAAGVREAILALKYHGVTAAADPLIAAADLRAIPADADCLVPVPMGGRRRRMRGFNQAELIARRLAGRLGRTVEPSALRRTRAAAPQARQPDLEARRLNVAGAFAARPRHVRGRRLLLVDDVTTSGATLDACAQALLDAGAESVDAWALARED